MIEHLYRQGERLAAGHPRGRRQPRCREPRDAGRLSVQPAVRHARPGRPAVAGVPHAVPPGDDRAGRAHAVTGRQLSHTDDDIDRTLEAIDGALQVYAKALVDGTDGYLVGRAIPPRVRPSLEIAAGPRTRRCCDIRRGPQACRHWGGERGRSPDTRRPTPRRPRRRPAPRLPTTKTSPCSRTVSMSPVSTRRGAAAAPRCTPCWPPSAARAPRSSRRSAASKPLPISRSASSTSGLSRRSSVPDLNDRPKMPTLRALERDDRCRRRGACAPRWRPARWTASGRRRRAAGGVGQRPHVLRQAGAAEGEAGPQVGRADVELGVGEEDLHHLVGVEPERRADRADLVGEGDLERVEAVVDVLGHLGDGDRHPEARARAGPRRDS